MNSNTNSGKSGQYCVSCSPFSYHPYFSSYQSLHYVVKRKIVIHRVVKVIVFYHYLFQHLNFPSFLSLPLLFPYPLLPIPPSSTSSFPFFRLSLPLLLPYSLPLPPLPLSRTSSFPSIPLSLRLLFPYPLLPIPSSSTSLFPSFLFSLPFLLLLTPPSYSPFNKHLLRPFLLSFPSSPTFPIPFSLFQFDHFLIIFSSY